MKELQQYIKSLNDELKSVCALKPYPEQLADADRLLTGGADAEKGMAGAVKNYNFDLIRLLISCGAAHSAAGKKTLAGMCSRGRFTPSREERFFALIDFAVSLTGFNIEYFAPYINNSLLEGRLDRMYAMLRRYGISDKEAADTVGLQVIFEIIARGQRNSLTFIENYRDWQAGALDTAVATSNDLVLNYILLSRDGLVPKADAVVRAIYEGKTDVLQLLRYYGVSFNNELYIKTACKAFTKNKSGLEFLFDIGLTAYTTYGGKTLLQNALNDGNNELVDFLQSAPKK